MTINDVIKKLNEVKNERGNLEVLVLNEKGKVTIIGALILLWVAYLLEAIK